MISSITGSIRLIDLQYTKGHPGYVYHSHRHTIFEFMYIISGKFEQVVNGHVYTLQRGDCLIIKPGMFHHTPPITEESEWFVFHFEVEDKKIHEILQMVQYSIIKREDEKSIHHAVDQFIKKYSDPLKKLRVQEGRRIAEPGDSAIIMLEIQSSILQLISLLARYFYQQQQKEEAVSIPPSHVYLAHEAAYWLEKRAAENFKISELAVQLNVNRSHLTQCFKKVYGMSPRNYLTKIRIRKAKNLLIDTDWTMEKISEELQFSSTAHFVKFFLKDAGLTPLMFRNHSRR